MTNVFEAFARVVPFAERLEFTDLTFNPLSASTMQRRPPQPTCRVRRIDAAVHLETSTAFGSH